MSILLFLDFDGVTHPLTGEPFSRICIEHIERAIEGFSVGIVISSTWRENYHLDEIRRLLGSQLGNLVIGKTPVIDDPFLKHVRYYEVLQFMAETNLGSQGWVGLDDTRGFYPADAPVIWCDSRTGMTDSEAKQLCCALAALRH